MRVAYVLVLCASWFCAEAGLASFITPCHENDKACHLTSAQKSISVFAAGLPALDLKPLDPLLLDKVEADQAGLKLEFRNTHVKGLRNCMVESLSRHGPKTSVSLKCSVVLVGDYTISGQLLILPVEGNGKYKIKTRDIVVNVIYDLKERTDAGEIYWSLDKWRFTYDLKTGAEFRFQNLFNGNKQLSDTVHQFANANWHDIFQEVGQPIVKAIVTKIVDEVRKLYGKVPKNQLSLD